GDHLLSLDRELDTLDPAAIQYQPIAESVRHYCEVGTVEHGTQERLGAVPAHTALLVHLELADTMIVPAVEVIGHGNTRLLSGFGETVENIPAQALTFHAPFIAGAMDLAATAPVVLHALEERQNAFPAPAGVTRDTSPCIVVPSLAAHVDHGIDGRTAPGAAAPGIKD